MSAGMALPVWLVPAIRIALAVAYPFIAHAASLHDSGTLAACALATIAGMVLVEGLLKLQAGAWLGLAVTVAGLAWLAQSPHAQLPLLLVPVAFIAMIAWYFARTLRPGSVPLISRIVAALEGVPAAALDPALQRYTRRLTQGWAGVLALLGTCNLVLAAIVVPGGLLAGFGITPPISVTETQWSWFANGLNYGLIGGVFVLEYLYRKRRFPGRYRNFLDFLQRMGRLGPAFWRDLFR